MTHATWLCINHFLVPKASRTSIRQLPPGLKLLKDFVSTEEESRLIEHIQLCLNSQSKPASLLVFLFLWLLYVFHSTGPDISSFIINKQKIFQYFLVSNMLLGIKCLNFSVVLLNYKVLASVFYSFSKFFCHFLNCSYTNSRLLLVLCSKEQCRNNLVKYG